MKKSILITLCIVCISYWPIKAHLDIEIDAKIKNIISQERKKERSPDNPMDKQKFLCVSLGFNCTPALNLHDNGLRLRAFPFDWNMTSLQGLCDIIENEFLDFLNPQYLRRGPGIYNCKYNLAFAHDFPVIRQSDGTDTEVENWQDYLPEITEKYSRRIERFNNVCNLAESVYFFRSNTAHWQYDTQPQDKARVIKLRDILKRKFPSNNWILVVINTSQEYQEDWGIDRVRNFYIRDQGVAQDWIYVFKKLGLL